MYGYVVDQQLILEIWRKRGAIEGQGDIFVVDGWSELSNIIDMASTSGNVHCVMKRCPSYDALVFCAEECSCLAVSLLMLIWSRSTSSKS